MTKRDNALAASIARMLREDVVRKLLAGNDTQCFTTEQYKKAYREHSDKVFRVKIPDRLDWLDVTAEMHLRGLSDIITEIRPGVWAANGGDK